MLAFFLLIALKLFIDNNVIIDASSTIGEKINEEEGQSLGTVYTTILFDKKHFNNEQRKNNAQMKVAYYFYKRFCYSHLFYYKSMNDFGNETSEFQEHFNQLHNVFVAFVKREMTSEPEFMACDYYKIFLQMNFDSILIKSEQWMKYIRKVTRHFFWLDNQWQKKEEFLENLKILNWQSNKSCTEKEYKHFKEYLKNSQNNYAVNFLSLKWLMREMSNFVKDLINKSENEFMTIKQHIYSLIGPIGFDRLELTRIYIMRIGSPLPEYTNVCLKAYLIGNEHARIYYQLRMSISFLTKLYFIYGQSINDKKKKIEEKLQKLTKIKKENVENELKNLKLNSEKFDRISDIIKKLLCRVGDLDDKDGFMEKAKAFLEQALYILLKCFEISAVGESIISDKSFSAMNEEYLDKFYDISDNGEYKLKSDENFAAMNVEYLLDEKSSMELKSMEREILPLMYFEEINKLLAGARADDEMQNILKKFGSIYRLASLIGGFDNLSKMPEMTRICLIRYLSGAGSLESTKFELRFALSYFLHIFNLFRISGSVVDKEKLDKIYEQIVDVKLVELIEVEHTWEEVRKLEEAICILLKFIETNDEADYKPSVSKEKILSINYQQAMQCTTDELEEIFERQGLMLQSHYYESMRNFLSADDKELENVLKYKDGAIYLLGQLIHNDDFIQLCNEYPEKIRDRKYFIDKLNEIRESFEIFMTTEDKQIRQVNKTKLEIYALMRWLDITLKVVTLKFNPFGGVLLGWHILFRELLDQLTVHPNHVKNIEIKCTIRGGHIAKLVKKWKKNPQITEQQIRNEYGEEDEKIEILISKYSNANEVPPLMDEFQEIIVELLQELVKEDKKMNKTEKVNMEKAKGINLWQYFNDLHNHSEQINHIYEILDRKNIRILYGKLGLKFHDDKFPETSIAEESLNEEKIESVDSLVKMIEGEQSSSKPADATKSAKKKNKKAKMNMTSTAADADEKIVIKEDDESAIQKIESSKVIRTAGKVAEKKTSKIEADDREKIETKGSEITMQKIEIPKVIPTGKVMEKKGGKPSALRKRKEKKEERNEQTRGTEIIEGSGMQSTGNQKHGQSFGQIIKLNILKRYEFKDLLEFNTLNMHYKELMKDIDNLEQRRFMDVLIFAFEIGQRLKALEIHTKLNGNEIELEKIRNEVDVIKINEFDDINELEKYLYNLLMRIEFAKMPIKNVEKNKIVDNIKKIKKMRKNLHAFRFAWIIQKWKEEESKNKNRGEEAENKDIKGILNALNLEEGTKFNEQIQIWKTILGQIKLDHKLYIERGIKTEKGKEIFDLAEYSQQLYFDNRDNKYENDLAENLIKGLEFVDIKDINRGEPIKYEWMKKYMKAKESVTKLVEEWHSFAKILFNGSYLVGTINSNSNLDIIILTYNLKIDDKQVAECIIEEKFDEHKKMQRERICKNDKLFLCQLCKESNVISAVKINSSLELVEAIICEDDDYESKSFDKCKFKMKVEFLFIILPVPDKPKKPVQIENNKTSFLLMRDENPLPDDYYLQILTSKEVKSDEIDQILVELYKLPERKKNFFSLLGFRDNIRMLELMPTADGKNFRIACAALKLWAKRNNIYASKVGFFKGFNMNILMVKIYLLYPTASVSFLIEQFLATYIVWPWPMPVQLQEITKLTYDRIAENPLWYDMDPNAVMPIISPGFIESNKASNVDQNTKIIINTIMSEGLKQIREIRAGNMGWSDFMRGHDLGKKYQHFLVVNCLTKIKKGSFGNDFCAIASLKIRDFIPNVIGKILPQEIDWYHIIEAGSRKKCFINREGYSDISNYKCDLWLVGLKPKKDNQIKWNELINLENSMNEASKTMYKDYFEFKQKKSNNRFGKKEKESLERNLLLITNYVKKEDLRKWNIQLRGWEIILN